MRNDAWYRGYLQRDGGINGRKKSGGISKPFIKNQDGDEANMAKC